MHLGTKTLVGLGASFALWCTLLYLANAALVRPSFEALELRTMESNCDRGRKNLLDQALGISQKVGDWSIWDDTYQFVADLNQAFVDSNLSEEAIGTLGLDFMAFVDTTPAVRHLQQSSAEVGELVTTETIATLVAFEPRLLRHDSARSSTHGLMRVGDHLMLVASRPIHRSDYSGESRGSLIAGKLVDDELIRGLANLTQLSISVSTMVTTGYRPVITKTEDRAQARLSLFDIYGRPIGTFMVSSPREIAMEGESALRLLLVALLLSSALALVTTLIGFDRAITRRLRSLNATMREIAVTGDLTQRAEILGKDEISELADTFNELTNTLHAMQEKLIAANAARTQFLANVSHEVRTPVTALLGFTDLLRDPKLLRHQHDDFVETISRNARHLLTVLNDLLDSAKLESGQMTIERIETPLSELLLDVVELARPVAAKKAIDVSARVEGVVPASVRTDPTRLRQILTNLVGNAIKFTEHGSVTLVVGLPSPKVLQIDVVDTGIGIAPDQLERLFAPFAQADASTTRRFGGTGLGLVLSRNLAKLLGGNVTVASEPGRGSTFTVTIAAEFAADVPRIGELVRRRPAEEASSPAAAAKSLEDRRILVVDDAPDNRRLVSFLLRRAGARVDLAEHGREGIDRVIASAAAHEPYDLVVMDMQMPVLDGYQATAELRRLGYSLPVLALTANAMQSDRDACMKAGCTDFATKPIDQQNLMSILERLLPALAEPARNPLADLWVDG
jgi:signal transduction histidine kinase/ActR/RegA family two-component response regulator